MARKGFFRGLRNWKVVVLSFVGASTFWFFNELNKEYTTRLIYPLEFNFQRDSVVIMEPLPQTLKVDVTSGGWNLLRRTFILFNPTPITIDLYNPTLIKFYTRATLLPIVTEQLDELNVNYLLTDTIFFDIEEKQSRRVPVKVDSMGVQMREGYRIVSPIATSPDSIEVIGPKSLLDTLPAEYIIPMTETRIDDDFNDGVNVPLSRADVTLAIPDEVTVTFAVDRFDRVSVPVTFDLLNFPDDSSAYPLQATIDVEFTVRREDREDDYEDTDFGITVDYNMLDLSDSTVLPILIYAPEEAFELDLVPENLSIIIEGSP